MTLEQVIKTAENLGIPDSTLSMLSGISTGTFSKLRNGLIAPNPEMMSRIERTLTQLTKLSEQVAPLPLNFSRVGVLRDILAEIETGKIIVVTMRQEEPEPVS